MSRMDGRVPSLGKRSDVLVRRFTEQIGTEFNFRPVHALCEVHAYRPELWVPARMKPHEGEARRRIGRRGWTHSLA